MSGRILLATIVGFGFMVIASGTPYAASKCSGDKIKNTGKKAASKLTCHAKAVAKGVLVDSTCLAKADVKFSSSFAKSEAKTYTDAGCLTTSDDTAIETKVDDMVGDVVNRLSGGPYCGNGVIDAGEDCDLPAPGTCTVGCRANCTCMCETACCYVEQPPLPPGKPAPDAECFQYSGNPAQVAAFASSCTLGGGVGTPGSLVGPFLVNSATPGPCAAPSPVFGVPCVPGPPTAGNLHILPADSDCP